jgi:hypothetical protein
MLLYLKWKHAVRLLNEKHRSLPNRKFLFFNLPLLFIYIPKISSFEWVYLNANSKAHWHRPTFLFKSAAVLMQACNYNLCELEVSLVKKVKFKTEYPARHHLSVKSCRGYGRNAFHFLKLSTLGGWCKGYILLLRSHILQTGKRSNESVKHNRFEKQIFP